MKCPKCGYQPTKKLVGKPRRFTIDQEKEIVEDRKKMILMKVANKWGCSIGTIQNIVNKHLTQIKKL